MAEEKGSNGINKSLYLSIEAGEILERLKEVTDRSESKVVTLLLEKYGPEIMNHPEKLSK